MENFISGFLNVPEPLISKLKFRNKYHGQDEIFEFLKILNDLMRMAKDLDIEPPYEEFQDVDELPRIEVEFFHLKHLEPQELKKRVKELKDKVKNRVLYRYGFSNTISPTFLSISPISLKPSLVSRASER